LLIGIERLQLVGQIPTTVVAGGEGEPAGEDQETTAVLARGDVQVRVSRKRWNGGEPRQRRCSSTMAVVFRRDGSPAVDWRLGRSSREARWFVYAPWRGSGWSGK
jgi:hypothetical protein